MAPSTEPTRVTKLVMPPEKHISVPKDELRRALQARIELPDRGPFDELSKLIEGVAAFDFADVKRRMREGFLPFAAGGRSGRGGGGFGEGAELDDKELEFVSDVYDVLRASHYHLLTKEEWAIAQAESFRLNLPVEVDWGYMDAALLSKFWKSTPARRALRARLPDEMADRILVFHRGVGRARLRGLLVAEKLDLLTEYTAMRLLDAILGFLPPSLWGRKRPPPVAVTRAASALETDAAGGGGGGATAAARALARHDSAADGELVGGAYVASRHKHAQAVERVTLRRLCPTVLTLLKAFPATLELQEPTFKDVVVVYRRAQPKAKGADPLGARNIYIKVFGETPMADAELLFPSKRVAIKPFDLVNLIVTVVTALATGVLMLIRASLGGKSLGGNVVWTAGSLIATRLFSVYSSAQAQKAAMQQDMSAQLYDRMQDSQEGVISAIAEEMADQQYKQMLLAYTLLLLRDRPAREDELDRLCEDFLVRDFDHRIDFQIGDALPRLERWGLVTRGAGGRLEALPLADAIDALGHAWSAAYRALGASAPAAGAPRAPTADLVSGRASAFGAGLDAYRAARAEAAAAEAAAAASKRGLFSRGRGASTSGGGGSISTAAVAASLAASGSPAPGEAAEALPPRAPTPSAAREPSPAMSMSASTGAVVTAVEGGPDAADGDEDATSPAPAAATGAGGAASGSSPSRTPAPARSASAVSESLSAASGGSDGSGRKKERSNIFKRIAKKVEDL